MTRLAAHLPAEEQPPVLAQALAAATTLTDDHARAKALTGLAPHLPADLLAQALAAAATLTDDFDRAQALTGLAAHLPAEEQPPVLAQALAAARGSPRPASAACWPGGPPSYWAAASPVAGVTGGAVLADLPIVLTNWTSSPAGSTNHGSISFRACPEFARSRGLLARQPQASWPGTPWRHQPELEPRCPGVTPAGERADRLGAQRVRRQMIAMYRACVRNALMMSARADVIATNRRYATNGREAQDVSL